MRIIFIPGLGEDELIYSKIAPAIEGEKLVLNMWELAGDEPRDYIDGLQYAREFMGRYHVTKDDLVIGHSTGGWIAYFLKHLTGCRIVQLSSWTNPDRIIMPISNHTLIAGGIKSGVFFNAFIKWVIVKMQYAHKPSEELVKYLFDKLKNGNNNNVINQLKIALTPIKIETATKPDLRIHAKEDKIIRPPREPFYEVPGDHFALYTYPKEVSLAINQFLSAT